MARHRFSQCGHVGLGAECHRCAQAQEIEVRATQIVELGKSSSAFTTKVELPAYVQVVEEGKTTSVVARAGGCSFKGLTTQAGVNALVNEMRAGSLRLRPKQMKASE